MKTALIVFLSATLLLPHELKAETLRLAVASNFKNTMRVLLKTYKETTGQTVVASYAATGKHYAQIKHGAPFDIFFAADSERPQRLEQSGEAIKGSRFIYAIGKLVLWSPDSNLIDSQGKVLHQDSFRKLAIANPKHAPYGRAAQQVLQHYGLLPRVESALVYGENVNQALHFVHSGNAQLGFVAFAQIKNNPKKMNGSIWHIPNEAYQSIHQEAVLLQKSPAATAFLNFVKSEAALKMIQSHGYGVPE